MDVSTCLLFLLFLSSVSGLILPLTKPNGDPDMSSIISHVTLMEQRMEQTITSLQTQVQTTNSKLQATEIELTTVKVNLQATGAKLQMTEDELKAVKADLTTAKTDIAILKHDLQKSPDSVEQTNMKSEFEALKTKYNSLIQPLNLTVIDSISSDVKSNMKEIQALNTRQNTTLEDLTATKSLVQSAVSDVKTVQTHVNTTIDSVRNDVKSNMREIQSVKARQNSTEEDLTATKSLVQSAVSDVKTAKTQVNTVHGDVNSLRQQVSAMNTQIDLNVDFQVTQRATNDSTDRTTLKFDTVDYSTGGGYNKTSGYFTAPVSGTYIFWAKVMLLYPVGWYEVHIYKGQQRLAIGYYFSADNDNGDISTMAVTHLDLGDHVHFTLSSTSADLDFHVDGYGYSSYGGVLLHAT